eukprot:m.339407 g.339407  ORF g.339407 m.339407 type:complete len:946 (+) comp18793_c0_seq1:194-3031(+)
MDETLQLIFNKVHDLISEDFEKQIEACDAEVSKRRNAAKAARQQAEQELVTQIKKAVEDAQGSKNKMAKSISDVFDATIRNLRDHNQKKQLKRAEAVWEHQHSNLIRATLERKRNLLQSGSAEAKALQDAIIKAMTEFNYFPAQAMTIVAHEPETNKKYKLIVAGNDKIEKIYTAIFEKFGIRPEQQQLYFKGEVLNKNMTLEENHIVDMDIIQVSTKKGKQPKVVARGTQQSTAFSLRFQEPAYEPCVEPTMYSQIPIQVQRNSGSQGFGRQYMHQQSILDDSKDVSTGSNVSTCFPTSFVVQARNLIGRSSGGGLGDADKRHNVIVKYAWDKTISFRMDNFDKDTLHDLKKKIKGFTKIAPYEQNLVINGHEADEDSTILKNFSMKERKMNFVSCYNLAKNSNYDPKEKLIMHTYDREIAIIHSVLHLVYGVTSRHFAMGTERTTVSRPVPSHLEETVDLEISYSSEMNNMMKTTLKEIELEVESDMRQLREKIDFYAKQKDDCIENATKSKTPDFVQTWKQTFGKDAEQFTATRYTEQDQQLNVRQAQAANLAQYDFAQHAMQVQRMATASNLEEKTTESLLKDLHAKSVESTKVIEEAYKEKQRLSESPVNMGGAPVVYLGSASLDGGDEEYPDGLPFEFRLDRDFIDYMRDKDRNTTEFINKAAPWFGTEASKIFIDTISENNSVIIKGTVRDNSSRVVQTARQYGTQMSTNDVKILICGKLGSSENMLTMDPNFNKIYGPDGTVYWEGAIEDQYTRGKPYFCPVGWKRYALRTDNFDDRFSGWNVSYFGLKGREALPILETALKTKFEVPENKERDGTAQSVHFTPSIVYASHPNNAAVFEKDGKFYQCVLQCRLKPSTFVEVEPNMINGKLTNGTVVDPNFDNNELDWVVTEAATGTNAPSSLQSKAICYGIMVRELTHDPKELDEARWWTQIEETTL